jgi:hypothetical protein
MVERVGGRTKGFEGERMKCGKEERVLRTGG